MPDDIFDQITKPKGDIFDQVKASVPAPQPTPQSMGLPDAAQQSKQQLLNNTPLGKQPKSADDLITGLQATGRVPESNPDLSKLAPAVGGAAGAGLAGNAAPIILKALGAGAGAAIGDVTQQATQSGPIDPTQALKTGAQYAGGEAAGAALTKYAISPFMKWLTASKSSGAQLLQQASAKAGNAPVELSPKTNQLVDEIMQQGKRGGGSPPAVIKDLLERVGTNPNEPAGVNKGSLTYDEARDFQSNASSLSVDEMNRLKGKMKYLVPQFAKSFSGDVQAGADQAGVGAEHAAGMKEYANASSRNRTLVNLAKATATVGGAYAGYKKIQDLKK